ncbi:hypothetical protein Tco_0449905 [Tanacetum coccineum]
MKQLILLMEILLSSNQVNACNFQILKLSDVIICAFFASQPNSPQLVHEDLQQIHPDDMEEMDLRWHMAMLIIEGKKFFEEYRRKLTVNGNETLADEGPNYALMAFSSSCSNSEMEDKLLLEETLKERGKHKKSSQDDGSKSSNDDGNKVDEDPRKDSECKDQDKEDNVNNTNNVNVVGTNEVNVVSGKTSIKLLFDPNMSAMEEYSIFYFSKDDEDDGIVADMNNLDITIQVSSNPTTRIHKDHPLDQVIGDLQLATKTRKMSKNLGGNGKNPKKIEEEVYVCQPPGFEDLDFADIVYKVEKALFTKVKTASTQMETQKPLLKDKDGEEVDLQEVIWSP